MKQILWVTLMFPIFMFSCTKQKTYKIKQEFLQAINFDTGSYFVYKDSLTHTRDSFWVYEFSRGARSMDDEDIMESMSCEMTNINGQLLFFKTHGSLSGIELQITHREDMFNRFVMYCMSAPFHPAESSNHGSTKSTSVEILNSYFVAGQSYSNVYFVSGSYRNYPDSTRVLTWFTPEAGLIKYRVDSSTTTRIWELVGSRVVRR